ncbi:crotonase/enoyl-CoA hydratase family protein [Nocardioides anomalus]|uniref:Crotonase/enoyl-CoA hydratase family protein n=1 Tax=Nocardioides anomalus TaxID=2712223 RepID=A0A6G6WEU1_9ACTN|nr:crotonase/enoyl-CoA hydratase family protein [Nocardioides anomalus]QIG43729.1 crotonase/enoyl-CoA hydratase family protein [Nocardioides anomalus]
MTTGTDVAVVTVRTTASAVVATLDDGKVNALGLEHVHGLRAALTTATEHELPLVLAGRPGVLSAGFELALVEADDDEDFRHLLVETELLCLDLLTAPVPVVVACTGHAVAAGVLLLLCADHRVGTTGDHLVGFTEVRLGMVLPDFALTLARARLDPRAFVRATVLGEALAPGAAVDAGFLDVVADDPVAAAEAAAADLAALVGPALATTRRLAHAPTVDTLLRQSLLAPDRQP